MSIYKVILLATDLRDDEAENFEKAVSLASIHQAKLFVVHALEDIAILTYEYPMFTGEQLGEIELEDKILSDRKKKAEKFAIKYNIPSTQVLVESGYSKNIILDIARGIEADLVLIGSHKKHGFFDSDSTSLLPKLGSTANAVLKLARCDVLVIHP